jgi:hypothetical protein
MGLRSAAGAIFLGDMLQRLQENWQGMGRRRQLQLVIGIVLVAGFSVGITWVLRNWHGDVVVTEPDARERLQAGEPELPLETVLADSPALPKMGERERAILERHFAAIGGTRRLATIKSLLSTGEISFPDGSRHDVVIAKKEGPRIRVSVRSSTGQRVMAVTPDDAWQCLWREGRLVSVKDLSDAERRSLRRSAYIVSELFLAMRNPWTVRFIGEQAFNYRMAHCFEVKLSNREVVRFFIDPETYLDLGREEWSFDAEGGISIIRHIGSEHMDIAGLLVPGHIETYENNVLLQTFVATDVEVNPGILDSTFDRPAMSE